MRNVVGTWWFKLALSVALLTLLVTRTDFSELQRTIARAAPGWLVVGFLAYFGSQFISAARWAVMARPLGFRQPTSHFIVWYLSGMYMNLFAPSTVAGDIGRALFLAGGPGRRTLALSSVLVDRILGAVALAWVGAVAVIVLVQYSLPPGFRLAAWVGIPATIAAWWWAPLVAVRVLSPESRWRKLVEEELEPYRRDRRLLVISFGMAIVLHLIQVASQIAIGYALALDVPWTYYLIFVPIVNIIGMAPVSINGVGIREAGYWFFLQRLAVDSESAIALGLLGSAVVLASGVAGAPFFLMRRSEVRTRLASYQAERENDPGSG